MIQVYAKEVFFSILLESKKKLELMRRVKYTS